ncbi:Clp protease ClpP [Rhizobium lentis]|uniref:head maturation protease, ClpP-related n=1 Tax=Rhizobium lentis TaxID=1138194 RepID=UPI001C82F132|nr:head maturation protease, ClpP-related [Rhizobium lentis]MBX4972345.1 Clp protease ClpP [Rhizobium lentis]
MSKLIVDGELMLYGPVGFTDFWDESGFTSSQVIDALTQLSGDIVVRLNSGGGIAMEGSAIHNALKRHDGRVIVKIDAIAASAASLIAMAGDEIEMPLGTLLMIHEPSGMTLGPADDHRRTAGVLDTMTGVFAQVYAERTGRSEKEIRQMMKDETWMAPQEALANGFATSVSEHAPTAATADAAFDYRTYAKAPDRLKRLATERKAMGLPMVAVASAPHKRKEVTMTEPSVTPADDQVTANIHEVNSRIYQLCTTAKMTLAEANNIVLDAKGDLAKAQRMIINQLADRDPMGGRVSPTHFADGNYSVMVARDIEDALYARIAGKPAQGRASEWQGRSLLDMGAALLEARGDRIISRNRDRLATQIMSSGATHSTSDFPFVTGNAANRFLLDAYRAAETPLKQLARVRNAANFKAMTIGRMSEMPRLEEVLEGAEITYGTRSEAKETYRIKTYAKLFGISREALINDDLDAFSDTLRAFGQAAAQTEADLIADLLLDNDGLGPLLDDGVTLFANARGNKAVTASALAISSVSAGRKALRDQKGLDNVTPLSLSPQFLIVGSGNETTAEQIIAATTPSATEEVNPFSGKLSLLVEPRLENDAWRLFASPDQAPILEIAYLNGVQQPKLETREGWNTLGTEFRAILDFGCGVTGWRGAYLNEGI